MFFGAINIVRQAQPCLTIALRLLSKSRIMEHTFDAEKTGRWFNNKESGQEVHLELRKTEPGAVAHTCKHSSLEG